MDLPWNRSGWYRGVVRVKLGAVIFGSLLALVLCGFGVGRAFATGAGADHQHDFDFEFGTWSADLKMLPHPLTGSQWVSFSGTSVVHELLGGRANIGELDLRNSGSRILGLSLRIFDPKSQLWNVYFANGRAASLDATPMVGRFSDGRGIFYNTETISNRPVRVRFIFSDITPNAFDLRQAFSTDGGHIWKDNWIARFTK